MHHAHMGSVEGWVVTQDSETIKTGFASDSEAMKWLDNQHSYSVDWAVKHEGYNIVLVRDGKVEWSHKRDFLKRPSLGKTNIERFHLVERVDKGGSYLVIDDPKGYIDANIGHPKYVVAYSYAYENQGLVKHILESVSPKSIIAYLNQIYVEPAAREKGLGAALMERMLQELDSRGVLHVYGHMAESKGKPKERLLRWLERFGFEEVDCCREDKLPVVAMTF